jgi:hypothetical protein
MNTAPNDSEIEVDSAESARPTVTTSRLLDLRRITTDPEFDRQSNLLRLQGWRGEALAEASATRWQAHRLGPAVCGVMSFAVIATGSMALLLITLASAIVGMLAANHPAESLYNAITVRRGGQPMPPNRAAKRTGCAVGSLFLAAAAIAAPLGYGTVAVVSLAALGSLALFVAATGICVPSIMSTLVFGSDRGTRPALIGRG